MYTVTIYKESNYELIIDSEKKMKKGFTLIELLVVIAIIGILSSVVLASLNTARDKGSNAAVKANLSNARAQAELYYDDHSNSYEVTDGVDSVCITSDGIDASVEAAGATCTDTATTWLAYVTLDGIASGDASVFCVDYQGNATTVPSNPSGSSCF